MSSTAAVVTIHNVAEAFEDWCAYHREHFDLIYVMVDDPSELEQAQRLCGTGMVVQLGAQIPRDSRLTQVLLRQDANANTAVDECLRRGIDWLLHLDGDELFLPQAPGVWDRDRSVGQMIFVNHEACAKWVAHNPFREIRHFKKNGRIPFLLYQGGKAAVRCTPGVRADGPHRFARHTANTVVSKDACILHYACFSFDNWYEKYRRLGPFSDWYKDDFRTPITLDFHLQSRNLVQDSLATGDIEACRLYFAQTVWDQDELDRRVASAEVLHIAPEDLLPRL
jgi:hypothetical protein